MKKIFYLFPIFIFFIFFNLKEVNASEILDSTYYYNDISTSTSLVNRTTCLTLFAMYNNITKVSFYVSSVSGAPTAYAMIYKDSSTLLATTSTSTLTASAWNNFSFGTTSLDLYTKYFICLAMPGSGSTGDNYTLGASYSTSYQNKLFTTNGGTSSRNSPFDSLSNYIHRNLSFRYYYDDSITSSSCEDDLSACELDLSECQAELASSTPLTFDDIARYNEITAISNYTYASTSSTTIQQVQTRYYLPLAGYLLIAVILYFITIAILVVYFTR